MQASLGNSVRQVLFPVRYRGAGERVIDIRCIPRTTTGASELFGGARNLELVRLETVYHYDEDGSH
jgi:hypothetical protein